MSPRTEKQFEAIREEKRAKILDAALELFEQSGFEDPYAETMILAALLDGIRFHYIMDPDNYPLEKIKNTLIERYVKHPKTD